MRRIERVALVYDDRPRPETTGVYCRRALAELAEVEHFLPDRLSEIPRNKFDLLVNVDDGLRYNWPKGLSPAACWVIDTHVDFEWSLTKAAQFDFVFAAQKEGAQRLCAEGITNACWLPLACDPAIHRPHGIAKEYDVAFVGNVFEGPRQDLLRLIRKHYPDSFVGLRYFDEMAKTYSASRIVFNRSLKDDLNMRVFEALGCGACLVTNRLDAAGQSELFQDGVHLVTYADADELLDKLRFYLARDALRERIGKAARAIAIERHTYRQRIETLLETVASARSSKIAPVPAEFAEAGQPPKQSAYYDFARPELLNLIPTSCRNILELGCGRGRLGESVKARQSARYIGIELDQNAADIARARLDQVHLGDVESPAFEIPEADYDCIVCGDVLEHLRDPLRILKELRKRLTPDGVLVASIPNVQYHQVVAGLLEGNWTYEPAGILDDTHRHFFTRFSIEQLLYRAGFAIERWGAVPGPGDNPPAAMNHAQGLRIGRIHLAGLSAEQAQGFLVYQYLLVARPVPVRNESLTSLVLATHNEGAYTRACLDSVRARTDEPYELIVVDNGSTDDTLDYLRACDDVRLIANGDNRGFPAAVNQGLAVATGRQVVLLNNDVVVTTGWLRRMLSALEQAPEVGLVGPLTNCTSGPQRIEPAYRHLDELDWFAWQWGLAHDGQRLSADMLMGFCLLIRRAVVEQIGGLDERFGIGVYEDIDFCRRALQAGYKCLIAADSYVHHFGHRTFIGQGIDADEWLARNERVYSQKWETADGGQRIASSASPTDDGQHRVAQALARITGRSMPAPDCAAHESARPRGARWS